MSSVHIQREQFFWTHHCSCFKTILGVCFWFGRLHTHTHTHSCGHRWSKDSKICKHKCKQCRMLKLCEYIQHDCLIWGIHTTSCTECLQISTQGTVFYLQLWKWDINIKTWKAPCLVSLCLFQGPGLNQGQETVQKSWNRVSVWTKIKLEIHQHIQYAWNRWCHKVLSCISAQ